MKIIHKAANRRFFAFDDEGQRVGEIEYEERDDGYLYATHTYVKPEFEGQGIAGKLLAALTDWARSEKKKIVPVCSYVVGAFKRNPERYRDVAAENERANPLT